MRLWGPFGTEIRAYGQTTDSLDTFWGSRAAAVPILLKPLQDGDPAVALNAARRLAGSARARDGIQVISRFIDDPSPNLLSRRLAARALKDMEPSIFRCISGELQKKISARLTDPDEYTRVCLALAFMKSDVNPIRQQALNTLAKALESKGMSEHQRISILLCLATLGAISKDAIPLLWKTQQESSPMVQSVASKASGYIAKCNGISSFVDAPSVQQLRRMADDASAEKGKRAKAIMTLFALHLRPPTSAKEICSAIGPGEWLASSQLENEGEKILMGRPTIICDPSVDSLFRLALFPDHRGWSDWRISLRLSGPNRDEKEVLSFLHGDEELVGSPLLMEFVLCFPGGREHFTTRGVMIESEF
jgi:hypothetical protein